MKRRAAKAVGRVDVCGLLDEQLEAARVPIERRAMQRCAPVLVLEIYRQAVFRSILEQQPYRRRQPLERGVVERRRPWGARGVSHKDKKVQREGGG